MPEPILPDLITIPAGRVWLGATETDQEAAPNEQPAAWVEVPAFAIARTPVTVEEFVRFVETGGAPARAWWAGPHPPAGQDRWPVTQTAWDAALDYCAWLSRDTGRRYRLPTETEWERAAKADTRRIFPWGDRFDPDCANVLESGRASCTPVDAHPAGASPWGLLDMAGNAWEWTSDVFAPYPYAPLPPELIGPAEENESRRRALRGGSRMAEARWARCSARTYWRPFYIFSGHVGLRVACDLEEKA